MPVTCQSWEGGCHSIANSPQPYLQEQGIGHNGIVKQRQAEQVRPVCKARRCPRHLQAHAWVSLALPCVCCSCLGDSSASSRACLAVKAGQIRGLLSRTWATSSLDLASPVASDSTPIAKPCSTSPPSAGAAESLPAEWISSSDPDGSNGMRREFESSCHSGHQ